MSRWRNRELGRKQLWQTSAKRRKHRLEAAPWSERIDETRVHVLKPETMSTLDLSHDPEIYLSVHGENSKSARHGPWRSATRSIDIVG